MFISVSSSFSNFAIQNAADSDRGIMSKKTRGHNNSTTKFGQLRNTFEPQRHMDKHVSVSKHLNQLRSWGFTNQSMKGS